MKTISRQFVCLAVAVMASAAIASAAPITIPVGSQHIIKNADVHTTEIDTCHGAIYRW